MRRTLSALPFVLGTGLVTGALAERAFWGRLRPDDSVADSLFTLAAYTAVCHLGLVAVRRMAVADVRRLFLVGALVGWIVEGMVVGTVYETLPLSISWTALAWHAPLSVVVGWYVFPRLLGQGGRRAWIAAGGGGVAMGAWSAFMSVDAGVDPDPGHAMANAAIVAAALGAGYALHHRFRPGPGALGIGRPAIIVACLVVAWALLGVVPAVPFAPLVLVPLVAVTLRALRRGAPAPDGAEAFAVVPGVPARHLAPLLLVPPAAAAGCLLAAVMHAAPYVGYAVYAVATPGGAVAFVMAARRRRSPAEVSAVGEKGALRM